MDFFDPQIVGMSLVELVAAVLGLVGVWLTVRQHIACWPVGLGSVLLYVGVFYRARLYSDMVLHVFYVFLQLYGWYKWRYGGKGHAPLPVTRVGAAEGALWAAAGAAGTAALGWVMAARTDAAAPFWDAGILVFSLIAQYLMARKVLENWLIWIAIDVIAVNLFAVRGLYPTAVLYAIFLVLCVLGIRAWKKTLVNPKPA